MIPKITQENLHILIPRKVASVVERYAESHRLPLKEALMRFYSSETYAKLSIEQSKLWYYGVNYVYEEFVEEQDSLQQNTSKEQ